MISLRAHNLKKTRLYITGKRGHKNHHPDSTKKSETSDLHYINNQMEFTNIYKIFHQTVAKDYCLQHTHKTSSKIDNILGHGATTTKFSKNK